VVWCLWLCVVQVLAPLGADITGSQFLEPNGTFPNHIPNPENKEAMAAAVDMVKQSGEARQCWLCSTSALA
jgi:phosphomannomutase